MNQNLQKQNDQKLSKNEIKQYLITYLDGVFRGLISFFVIGIGLYLLLVGVFKISFIFVLPIIFITTIIASPFFSKIKIGERLLTKYDAWLKRIFKLNE